MPSFRWWTPEKKNPTFYCTQNTICSKWILLLDENRHQRVWMRVQTLSNTLKSEIVCKQTCKFKHFRTLWSLKLFVNRLLSLFTNKFKCCCCCCFCCLNNTQLTGEHWKRNIKKSLWTQEKQNIFFPAMTDDSPLLVWVGRGTVHCIFSHIWIFVLLCVWRLMCMNECSSVKLCAALCSCFLA